MLPQEQLCSKKDVFVVINYKYFAERFGHDMPLNVMEILVLP
jgi:hypothetical protein